MSEFNYKTPFKCKDGVKAELIEEKHGVYFVRIGDHEFLNVFNAEGLIMLGTPQTTSNLINIKEEPTLINPGQPIETVSGKYAKILCTQSKYRGCRYAGPLNEIIDHVPHPLVVEYEDISGLIFLGHFTNEGLIAQGDITNPNENAHNNIRNISVGKPEFPLHKKLLEVKPNHYYWDRQGNINVVMINYDDYTGGSNILEYPYKTYTIKGEDRGLSGDCTKDGRLYYEEDEESDSDLVRELTAQEMLENGLVFR
jgi:hypothetical protein